MDIIAFLGSVAEFEEAIVRAEVEAAVKADAEATATFEEAINAEDPRSCHTLKAWKDPVENPGCELATAL